MIHTSSSRVRIPLKFARFCSPKAFRDGGVGIPLAAFVLLLVPENLQKDWQMFAKTNPSSVSREIDLPKVNTFEQARNKALDILCDLGQDSKPFMITLSRSKGYGKIGGRQTADGKKGWRLDYDPEKGLHINIWDYTKGKGSKSYKSNIRFDGNEDTFVSLLKHLN
jgi:hypothetical protein